MNIRTYKYGSPLNLPPIETAREQLFFRNRYWNDLVAIDHEFRRRYREIVNGANDRLKFIGERLEVIGSQIKDLRKEIKVRRQAARSRQADVTDLRDEINALISERKPLIAEANILRPEVRSRIKPLTEALNEEYKARKKATRQEFAKNGLYWGNYNDTEKNFEKARSGTLKENTDLRFHRYSGTGKWTCQIQHGMKISDVFSLSDNRFQIDPVPPNTWDMHVPRGERRRLSRTKARIRISSTENLRPIWLEIPIIMHRNIPEDALIKSVSINYFTIGGRPKYSLDVVTNEDSAPSTKNTGKVIAIDIGWRKKEKGLRVGYWVDDQNRQGEILLDESFISTQDRLDGLNSVRDKMFNVAKGKLSQWLAESPGDKIPSWLKESTIYLKLWKSYKKLVKVILQWRNNRFEGDGLYDSLEEWRKQDKHLWTWQANLYEKMKGRRLDQYRILANDISDRFDIIIMEDFDLSEVKTKGKPEDKTDVVPAMQRFSTIASVGRLRNEIALSCGKKGKAFVKANPYRTTLECPFCAGEIESEPKADIMVTCGKCGLTYDQDWAASLNMMKRWFAQRDFQGGSEACKKEINDGSKIGDSQGAVRGNDRKTVMNPAGFDKAGVIACSIA